MILFALVSMALTFADTNSGKSKLTLFDGSFEEAIKLAKKENKAVFIDGYTSWCGWCKELDKRTFSDDAVAEYMNAHFINMKIDMESTEGAVLAQKYRVRGYPSLLFIDHNKEVAHRIDGFVDAASMLNEAKVAQERFEKRKK